MPHKTKDYFAILMYIHNTNLHAFVILMYIHNTNLHAFMILMYIHNNYVPIPSEDLPSRKLYVHLINSVRLQYKCTKKFHLFT